MVRCVLRVSVSDSMLLSVVSVVGLVVLAFEVTSVLAMLLCCVHKAAKKSVNVLLRGICCFRNVRQNRIFFQAICALWCRVEKNSSFRGNAFLEPEKKPLGDEKRFCATIVYREHHFTTCPRCSSRSLFSFSGHVGPKRVNMCTNPLHQSGYCT